LDELKVQGKISEKVYEKLKQEFSLHIEEDKREDIGKPSKVESVHLEKAFKSRMLTVTRQIRVIVVLAILAVAGAGGVYFLYNPQRSGTATSTTRAAPQIPNPDTFVHLVAGDPQFLDPATDYETAGGYIIMNIYETLIWYKGGSAAKLEPLLAESWEISAGGTTYTFRLRRNVKFHDDTPFNASAVKYSIDRMILINEPNGPSWMYDPIKGAAKYMSSKITQADMREYLTARGIEVVDDYTVRINLDRSYAPIIYILAFSGASIVSPTAVEKHGGVVPGKHNDWMDRNMIGTGPYKFVEWVSGQRIVIDAFEGYWRPSAKIKKAIIRTVPESRSRESALFAGEADAVAIPAANIWDVMQRDSWIKEGKPTVRTDLSLKPVGTSISIYAAYPQLAVNYIGMNARQKPLDNRDFRYGLSYVFDYKRFISEVAIGFMEPGKGPIPRGLFGFDENIFSFSYDPAKAKEYFAKAKAVAAYRDGLSITYYYNTGNEMRRRGGLLLKDSVDKLNVGFTIDVQELDWPTFLTKTRGGEAPLFLLGWIVDYADPHDFAQPFGHSRGVIANRVGLSIPGLDDKIMKAAEIVDPVERALRYADIANTVNQEAYYIWVGQPTTYLVFRDWVKITTDSELNMPTQANPMYYGYYLYAMWKGS